jgi:two-component system cell cycle sensor histidine kinase/response regulator CckA
VLPTGTDRILLIDDEQIVVEMGTAILERLGYWVTPETNSLRALEIFRSRPGDFGLIITDYTMPKLSGADLSKEIRQIRPDIPIILCTGFSEKVTPTVAMDLGMEFVMKPFSMKQIAELVRKVLWAPES